MVEALNKFQNGSRLYLVPYNPFYIEILRKLDTPGYELLLFRRFMVRVAERIAIRMGHKALITGDSLGQVASQTLENISALHDAVKMPIIQPLISFDKQEIIDIDKKIETYDISLKAYKDCCSILSSGPRTKPNMEILGSIEGKLDLEKTLEKTLELVELYES